MPTLFKNGKNYSGTSVSLTQAEYDALSESAKMNGTVYFITDSDAVLNASDVALGSGTVRDLANSIAPIESSPALANHAAGEYIVYNGQFYRVTSAISAGNTLTGKITAVTVGSEFGSLKVQIVSSTGTSLTNYTTQGIYWFSSGVTPSDIPEGVNGWLVVIPSTTGWVKQIWFRAGTPDYSDFHTWTRTYNGSTWGSWYRLITSADMTSTMTSVESSTIPDFTINASGYYNVQSYAPSAPSGYTAQFYLIGTWSSISTNDAISLTWDAHYVLGSAGATVKGLKIRAICTKNI